MGFSWSPRFSSEWEAQEPPSIWFFLALYLIVQGFALAMVVPDLPKVGSIPWDKVIHDAVAVPFFCWVALSCMVWLFAYDIPASSGERTGPRGSAVEEGIRVRPDPGS